MGYGGQRLSAQNRDRGAMYFGELRSRFLVAKALAKERSSGLRRPPANWMRRL